MTNRLLVIEHCSMSSSWVMEYLQGTPWQVTEADSLELGLALAKTHRPNLVICVDHLPHLDGFDALQELRAATHTQSVQILMISDRGDRSSFRRAMAMGADDFLSMPFSPAELQEAIETRLHKGQPDQSAVLSAALPLSQGPEGELPFVQSRDLAHHFLRLHEVPTFSEQDLAAEKIGGFILMSIDQLNWFRSTSGPHFSDEVLRCFEQRLWASLPETVPFMARVEENLYALMLPPDCSPLLTKAADGVWQQRLSLPLTVEDQEILITTSIASIQYSLDAPPQFEVMLGQARQLLNRIKRKGGNQILTEPFLESSQASDQFAIATNILRGLTEDQFHAYYQPQVDLSTGQFVGAEALVRWHHPDWGVLEPGRFIPVAEETGVIAQIDERVLRLACQAMQRWSANSARPLTVSINLSGLSFNRPNLCELVEEVLNEYGVAPEWLELEVTESILMQDTQKSAQTMRDLKALGVSLAIDDFGVGYSSLSYLQQFPFDTLKIDQCFIQNVDQNPGNGAITEAVVKLAHTLNLRVVAEGVERIEEREFLRNHGCDVMQGYLVSPPVPRSVFETFLTTQLNKRPSYA
ncbi:EAL domain-containing protein [Lyngbya confervoides]|uniref:EAL domain-containing protein n=1 Tax=Lyngbya confervoides BDU141951 TaxID=1574623 RepID=A0ABD4T420_9CYAN|nr:EAL domain-containing protein [Lyngbya confervoides]MCM1983433.1 EAL domain-containing protein [Lyngbya confervoides BDU141951]